MNSALVGPDPDSQFALVGDMRLHFKRSGSGRALLLLHGSGSSNHGFERVAEHLSSSFDVIAPDLPGFGFTGPRPDRDYRVATYVDTVVGFMTGLGLERFSVVGNSLGGNVGWNLALAEPSRVENLVLINATGYPEKSLPLGIRLARNPILRPLLRRGLPKRATERNLRALVGRPSIVDEAMVDRVHAMMSLPGNRSAFVDFANTVQEDRSDRIPLVAVPTLVLRSVSIDGQHFGRDIPGAVELTHPTGGHLLPEEDPEWVAARVRDFLEDNLNPDSGLAEHLHRLGVRTLAFSAYGRGYSQRLTGDYDEALFVGQLTELVDALRLPRHHVVGTSMGAVIAMAYVTGRSDIESLTLAGPAGLSDAPASRWLFKSDHAAELIGRRLGRRLLESHLGHNVRDDASATVLTRMVRDAFRYHGSMYALFSTLQNLPLHGRAELFRSAGRSGIPTMLIWGDDDQVTPIASFDEARTLLQPRECHVIAQCGHMTPLERPAEVARLVASFTTNPAERPER